jgi:cofilin
MQASLVLDEAIASTFNALRMKRSHRYIIVGISEDGKNATCEHVGERAATFAEFKSKMPSDEPRYAIYDLEFVTKDGRHESKLVFIMYSPDTCTKGTLRFVYAQNKDAIKAKMSPVHKEL